MIFTSISPNAESDDVRRAAGLLFKPWTWRHGEAVSELERAFAGKLAVPDAVAFQSGRNALYAILKAFGVHEGDEVLIQAYTCVAVPEPVMWVGALPIYVDVGDDLCMDPTDLRKKITSRSKALVIQHTFGVPARMGEIIAFAHEYGLIVIEDCAHSLGTTFECKPVGTMGDAAFFSFGRDKSLSCVFGGIAVARDPQRAAQVRSIRDSFSDLPSGTIFKYLLHPIVTSFAKKTYRFLSLGKAIMAAALRVGLIPRAVESAELSGGRPSFFATKMPNAIAILALHQLGKTERYAAARKNAAKLYAKGLPDIKHQKLSDGAAPLRYVLFVERAPELIKAARRAGIELGDWYDRAIAPAKTRLAAVGYAEGSCTAAERYARMSVDLPTHALLTDSDIQTIISFIRTALAL